MKIVVVGGGYAGLGCLLELGSRVRDAQLHLYDPRSHHLKITHLHETVHHPLDRYQVSFAELASRMGFEHHCENLSIEDTGVRDAAGQPVEFDFLVVATGAEPPALPRGPQVYDRTDLVRSGAREIVDDLIADQSRPRVATVVGGGATGIQFLFELYERFRRADPEIRLRLVDREARLLVDQPKPIGAYVLKRLASMGVEYLPSASYVSAGPGQIEIEDSDGRRSLDSGLVLLCAGARPYPATVRVDCFGRIDGDERRYAAGDCAVYDSRGDDAMTAQVAVRQGKHVARNIDRASRGVQPLEYFFRELGYVVSLGSFDAVGWMLLKNKVLTGLPAFVIKAAVEAQYDLFVSGIDTYVV